MNHMSLEKIHKSGRRKDLTRSRSQPGLGDILEVQDLQSGREAVISAADCSTISQGGWRLLQITTPVRSRPYTQAGKTNLRDAAGELDATQA